MKSAIAGGTSRNFLLKSAGAAALMAVALAPSAGAIVPNDNYTPEEIVDDEGGVNGVGLFYRADGFVCTGTLINPRTVLFAAHCVNNVPEEAFGDEIPASFSFNVDNREAVLDWFANDFNTNTALNIFNVSQVQYNAASLANPQALGFLEADIALATLDTPAVGIPTWALLFSPLPTPDTIDPVDGTGYHVNITGYGRTGSGTAGDVLGVDLRRRAAENMLGALASQDDRNAALFGESNPNLPQNLYSFDFDDPEGESRFDFNLFLDEARVREGTTAGGDSGGPLILDAANNDLADEDLQIGVLSGGSRFFLEQGFSMYGTESFYQPLYLFYEYIAETNPYRYVSATAGDGNWEDPTHWVTEVDPNYRIIDANGNVVTGVPGEASEGINGTDPDFGAVCFDPRGDNPGDRCVDYASGEPVDPVRGEPPTEDEEPQAETGNFLGKITIEDVETSNGLARVNVGESQPRANGPEIAQSEAQAGPLPDPTLANGLPGASGFVPDNSAPDAANDVQGKFYDVTLSADGTTTLSSAVEIDNLGLSAMGAGLDITSDGDLTSLIAINQMAGSVNVDGRLATLGDYLIMSGMLSGSGIVDAPFVTSVGGAISPGSFGSVGTLTIDGSLVLSSGSLLLVDIASASSDRLNVTGDASLGGTLQFAFVDEEQPSFGDEYVFLNVSGEATGDFDTVAGFGPGVLQGDVTAAGGVYTVSVDAVPFSEVISADAPVVVQTFGNAFTSARGSSYDALSDVYQTIDLLGPGELEAAFSAIAPEDALAVGHSALQISESFTGGLQSRLSSVRRGTRGFVTTAPANTVAVASADAQTAFSAAASQLAANEAAIDSDTYEMKQGYGGFFSVDFYTGDGESAFQGRGYDTDGVTVMGGLDRSFENGAAVGVFASYGQNDVNIDPSFGQVEADGGNIGLYGYAPVSGRFFIDGYGSVGSYSFDTQRQATIAGGLTLGANGSTDADQVAAGASFGIELENENGGLRFTPNIGIDHVSFDVDETTEQGSAVAITIASRDVKSTQLSLGGLAEFDVSQDGRYRLIAGGDYVHELESGANRVTGTLNAAPGSAPIILRGAGRSDSWFEVQAGFAIDISETVGASLNVRHNIGRDDVEQTQIGGNLSIRF